MAKSASATDILPLGSSLGGGLALGAEAEPLLHGGDLGAARRLFPGAPEPFLDLSTGINPKPYPLPRISTDVAARLPDSTAMATLAGVAARNYGAPSAAHVVCAPGTQILLPLVARLVQPGRAHILAPTYGEFARVAALSGHSVKEVGNINALSDADLAILANPNNPDGRLHERNTLIAVAERVRSRGGLFVVDEAFADVAPPGTSLTAELSRGNIIVLRSFGKFFGLAGIRLGFALAAPPLASRLAAALGPWAVSGPAVAVGTKALGDTRWIEATRRRLAKMAGRLDGILTDSRLDIVGGTTLFRLTQTPAADRLFEHLGRAGIFVRRFSGHPAWLRFGLPANEQAWRRLQIAMAAVRDSL